MRYAFLGPEGTFTEAALITLPEAATAECVPFPTVLAALTAVRDGTVDAAMVPLENSVEGIVPATADAFLTVGPLDIAAEVRQKVAFALMVPPGTRCDSVVRVISHPHAYAQCRTWVQQWLPGIRFETASSTAAAARDLRRFSTPAAAIAAPTAAERYGLEVVASDIGRADDAFTRFVLACRPSLPTPRPSADGASIPASFVMSSPQLLPPSPQLVSRKMRARQTSGPVIPGALKLLGSLMARTQGEDH